jgi:hypothetical protein
MESKIRHDRVLQQKKKKKKNVDEEAVQKK